MKSKVGVCERSIGFGRMMTSERMTAAAPTGRLTAKIARHENHSVR